MIYLAYNFYYLWSLKSCIIYLTLEWINNPSVLGYFQDISCSFHTVYPFFLDRLNKAFKQRRKDNCVVGNIAEILVDSVRILSILRSSF